MISFIIGFLVIYMIYKGARGLMVLLLFCSVASADNTIYQGQSSGPFSISTNGEYFNILSPTYSSDNFTLHLDTYRYEGFNGFLGLVSSGGGSYYDTNGALHYTYDFTADSTHHFTVTNGDAVAVSFYWYAVSWNGSYNYNGQEYNGTNTIGSPCRIVCQWEVGNDFTSAGLYSLYSGHDGGYSANTNTTFQTFPGLIQRGSLTIDGTNSVSIGSDPHWIHTRFQVEGRPELVTNPITFTSGTNYLKLNMSVYGIDTNYASLHETNGVDIGGAVSSNPVNVGTNGGGVYYYIPPATLGTNITGVLGSLGISTNNINPRSWSVYNGGSTSVRGNSYVFNGGVPSADGVGQAAGNDLQAAALTDKGNSINSNAISQGNIYGNLVSNNSPSFGSYSGISAPSYNPDFWTLHYTNPISHQDKSVSLFPSSNAKVASLVSVIRSLWVWVITFSCWYGVYLLFSERAFQSLTSGNQIMGLDGGALGGAVSAPVGLGYAASFFAALVVSLGLLAAYFIVLPWSGQTPMSTLTSTLNSAFAADPNFAQGFVLFDYLVPWQHTLLTSTLYFGAYVTSDVQRWVVVSLRTWLVK